MKRVTLGEIKDTLFPKIEREKTRRVGSAPSTRGTRSNGRERAQNTKSREAKVPPGMNKSHCSPCIFIPHPAK
jgi:hypothetical protein